jgi:hypothetical protein
MKWIGQHIYDLISRFRNDVYLESPTAGGSDPDKFLGIDSNNKIIYRTGTQVASDIGALTSETGDISSVTAGVGLSGGGSTSDVTLTVDFSEFSGVTPANGDSLATLDSDGSTEQLTTVANLATLFAGSGLTATNSVIAVDTLNQNTTGSAATLTTARNIAGVSFDGSANISLNNNAITNGAGYTTNTGDITGVTAGTNLSGGGSSGGVTINLADASTSAKGAALFDAEDFAVSSGTVTIKEEGVDLTNQVTGVLPSANLDADTAHYSLSRQFTHHMMTDNIGTDTKVYIALQETDAESSSATNKNLPFLVPGAGKLLKVLCRVGGACNTRTFTWTLETVNTSTNTASSPSVIGTQSGAGPTAQTMTTYDFTTSLDSGTNALSAGDTVQLGVSSDGATGNFKWYITCVWEFDLS